MNKSGLQDPTAEVAVSRVYKNDKYKKNQLINVFKIIADMCGYRIKNYIELERKCKK